MNTQIRKDGHERETGEIEEAEEREREREETRSDISGQSRSGTTSHSVHDKTRRARLHLARAAAGATETRPAAFRL